MSNFKQVSYFFFLFLLLNASQTLCHLPMPKKCTCLEDLQVKGNAKQTLESHAGMHVEVEGDATQTQSQESHAGKQVQVDVTQTKPKESNAGEVNTKQSQESHAGTKVRADATHTKESHAGQTQESHVGKEVKVNATQSQESHGGKQVHADATQTKESHAGQTQESHVGKEVKVNATQSHESHAGKEEKAGATQTKESNAGKEVKENTTPPQESNAGKEVKANPPQHQESNAGKATQTQESHTGQEVKVNATLAKESHAGQEVKANSTLAKESHAGQEVKANATVQTGAHQSELLFMKWVSFVGKLKHTTFKAAMNKVTPSYTITVDKNAAVGDFTCIQDAIDSLPIINLVRVVIKVNAGVYTEKVSIPPTKSFITIEGAGADKTIIQWGDNAQTAGPGGKPLGTFGSATFAVNSPYFIAKNITVKNTSPAPPPGAVGKQAVALRISADTASFVGCKFLGAQDTLYDHLGRHYYKDCYIEGSVDFIFGNGLSMFENCAVHAIAGAIGAVTAQARKSILEMSGFSFVNCRVTGSGALYLGRAWGAFSRVVFAYTYMDNIIIPKGWYNWGDPSREMTVFYGQYKCSGAGANHAGRVPWSRELTDEEAKPFISLSFIDGSEWVSQI